jgi:hypothetical protein
MSDETNDLFEPPLMSEIGEAQSYLDINRRIGRNMVALDYPGLCGITPADRLQFIAPAWAEERLFAIAVAAERALSHTA